MAKYPAGTIGSVAKWTLYYRKGGELACEWRRVAGIFNSEDGQAKAAEISRMGYRTIMNYADATDAHGLPIGWSADGVDYDHDTIEIERDERGVMLVTRWRSHKLAA